jgi:hypothetical protein
MGLWLKYIGVIRGDANGFSIAKEEKIKLIFVATLNFLPYFCSYILKL